MTDEELKKKCKERAKIFQQAMESCHSSSPIDCIEWFADRIAELEAGNERLTVSYETLKLHDEEEIGMLKSENAELKKELEITRRCWYDQKNISLDTNCKLHKARELLKGWLGDFYNPKAFYQQRAELVEQSEQFLSEVEK